MTIAQAFNEITVAQGGTPNNGGTITGAIDALNDALAGSDQEQGRTIEDAVRLLGQHIGGGGGSSVTVEALTATENKTYTAPEGKAYSPVTVNVSGGGGATSEVYLWNSNEDEYAQVRPTSISRVTGIADGDYTYEALSIENVTGTYETDTIYGVKFSCPAGSMLAIGTLDDNSTTLGNCVLFYNENSCEFANGNSEPNITVPMPLDGLYIVGNYSVSNNIN